MQAFTSTGLEKRNQIQFIEKAGDVEAEVILIALEVVGIENQATSGS